MKLKHFQFLVILAAGLIIGLVFLWDGPASGSPARAAPLRQDSYSVTVICENSTCSPVSLNNQGQVIGMYSGTGYQPFLWENDVFTELGFEGRPNDINNHGQIIGTRFGEPYMAVLWEDGEVTELGPVGGSEGSRLNDAGQAIVHAYTSTWAEPCLWASGVFTPLEQLAGYMVTGADDINNLGQVVGEATNSPMDTRTLLWEEGALSDLGDLGYGSAVINDLGQIADTNYLWDDGVLTDMGSLGPVGLGSTRSVDINNLGQVVGSSIDEIGGDYLPFIWENGTMTLLTDLVSLPGNPDPAQVAVYAINDAGQILVTVGDGSTSTVYLLTPLESPGFSIAGRVTDEEGEPMPDVTVATGTGDSALTNASGLYTITGVLAGAHNLFAVKGNTIFTPTQRAVLLPPDAIGQDFVGASTLPDAVFLELMPGTHSGEITLQWEAPADYYGNPVVQYDLRTHTAPIDESNWTDARQLTGGPTPGQPGEVENHYLSGFPPNTRRYFAMKSMDSDGTWSPLSNVSSAIDSNFRPSPHGYGFFNFTDVMTGSDFILPDDLYYIFGGKAICQTGSPSEEPPLLDCQAKPAVAHLHEKLVEILHYGRCVGMSATSLRFYTGLDDPAAYQPGAASTFELEKANARRLISWYQLKQLFLPIARDYFQPRLTMTLNQIVEQLQTAIQSETYEPFVIGIDFCDKTGGHAVVGASMLTEQEEGVWRIWLYDSNHPSIQSGFIEIDTNDNKWRYDNLVRKYIRGLSWECPADKNAIGMVPVSIFEQPLEWDEGKMALSKIEHTDVKKLGQITDVHGQALGYVDGELVQEIPGAFATMPYGALTDTMPMEPIYYLPLTGTYTTTLSGAALTETTTVSMTQLAPGYAVWVEGVELGPGEEDLIWIRDEGARLGYRAAGPRQVTMGLALDGVPVSYDFEFQGVDLGSTQRVTLTAVVSDSQVLFNNALGGNGAYDLAFLRVTTAGESAFQHGGLNIGAGATHMLDFSLWAEENTITLNVDHNSDGTIDETVVLENQAVHPIYLPLIMK